MRLLILIASMFSLSLSAQARRKPFHVVIDPGHGGLDSGATRNGIREADIALSVSRKLRGLLLRDLRFKVSMTRNKNVRVDLKERAKIANRLRADMFISVHANASHDRRVSGAEFYLQNHLEPTEEALFLAAREEEADNSVEIKEQIKDLGDFGDQPTDILTILDDLVRTHRIVNSDKLAGALSASWKTIAQRKRNAVRQAPFFLVSNVNMPSILIELGYLSNSRDKKLLTSTAFQKKMAKSIYDGIVSYQKSVEK